MKQYFNLIYKDTKDSYFKKVSSWLKNNELKFIITANPETLTMASNDTEVNDMLLDKSNSIIPDGIAIVKAGNMLGFNIKERIAGVDVAEYLLSEANKQNKSLYLFGAKEEVINLLVSKIKEDFPNIKILGYSNGYVEDRDKVFKKIIKLKPDVCLVALGIPYQEKLIYKYLDKIDKGIYAGVGGSFDVISGSKKRAPKIFIKLNLEWLYRIIKEPKRLKRFWNNNIKFMIRIKKEKK